MTAQIATHKLPTLSSLVILASILSGSGCSLLPPTGAGGGGDGAPDHAPDLSRVEDAIPRSEPLSRYGNPSSYEVFGKRYEVMSTSQGYSASGLASWYGTKFHGRRTSSGEPYDMYGMTAAHKSLPLPTYVEVTNTENGRSTVVRVNDRGPFHNDRLIDLSYAAASKLGVLENGTAMVKVRAINPTTWRKTNTRNTDVALSGSALNTLGAPAAGGATSYAGARPGNAMHTPTYVATHAPNHVPDKTMASGRSPAPVRDATLHRPVGSTAPATTAPGYVAAATPALSTPPAVSGRGVFLQAGAFSSHSNALRMRQRLKNLLSRQAVRIQSTQGANSMHRVQIGPLASREQELAVETRLQREGIDTTRVVLD